MSRIAEIRNGIRRNRELRRTQLTRSERMLVWTLVFAPGLLALVGVVLLLNSNGIGIALLVLALVVMAIPVSPLLRAMARRREARATKRTPPR